MQKTLVIAILILITTITIVYASIGKNEQNNEVINKKILITYFSYSGNTKYIAELIQIYTGGELYEIKTKQPYSDDYTKVTQAAKYQISNNILPQLKENKDISSYDVIFIGTPAWWYTMAPAVRTFLTNNNFENKKIVPFITHGGGGKYKIDEEMGDIAKNAKVLEPLVIYGRGGNEAEKKVEYWLEKFDF